MRPATKEEDAQIVATACMGYCFNGYKGMDTCGKCHGVGSQLVLVGMFKRYPNTHAGYHKALADLRKSA